MGGVWVQLLEGQGARARVIFVLHECIWNTSVVSLVLPTFDDTGSLVYQLVYPPGEMVPPWVTASRYLALKPITFSSLLLFRDFQSFLFS